MKELYECTKQFILKNYKGELDEKTLDILTVSILSLFIKFPEVTKDKMPDILGRLEIFFGDKEVAEMAYEKYPEYPKNELTRHDSAFVTRALGLNKEDNMFNEEWAMFVSTLNSSHRIVDIISRTTHEFIHLLRFNGIIDGPTEAKIRDGVSVARCNKETKTIKRKHYNMEEGIVEFFTIKAMNELFEYVKGEDVSFSPVLDTFKRKFNKDFKASYQVERFFLDGLTRDKKFLELLEYSFVDTSEPLQLVTYYNNTVASPSGFTALSRGLDRVVDIAHQGDVTAFDKASKELIGQINGFLAKKKH